MIQNYQNLRMSSIKTMEKQIQKKLKNRATSTIKDRICGEGALIPHLEIINLLLIMMVLTILIKTTHLKNKNKIRLFSKYNNKFNLIKLKGFKIFFLKGISHQFQRNKMLQIFNKKKPLNHLNNNPHLIKNNIYQMQEKQLAFPIKM